MPHGKTVDLQAFGRMMRWRKVEEREQYPRDRSLRGKARRRARKIANKEARR